MTSPPPPEAGATHPFYAERLSHKGPVNLPHRSKLIIAADAIRLEWNQPSIREAAMIALRLVHLIENHSAELADGLVHKLMHSERTHDLMHVPAAELHDRCHEIYRHLSDWLVSKPEHDIEVVYRKIGARRAEQGVSLPSITWALILTKEHLWDFLEKEDVLRTAVDLFGELELLRLLDQFFDRAIYHLTEGYVEHEMAHAA